jgi:hypothetical protein
MNSRSGEMFFLRPEVRSPDKCDVSSEFEIIKPAEKSLLKDDSEVSLRCFQEDASKIRP